MEVGGEERDCKMIDLVFRGGRVCDEAGKGHAFQLGER